MVTIVKTIINKLVTKPNRYTFGDDEKMFMGVVEAFIKEQLKNNVSVSIQDIEKYVKAKFNAQLDRQLFIEFFFSPNSKKIVL
jgi:hypothetical protein